MKFVFESNKLRKTNRKLNELLNESSFIDPIRFNIKVDKTKDINNFTDYMNRVVFKHLNITPEVLAGSDDGEFTICLPGIDDYVERIQGLLDESSREGQKFTVFRNN